MKKRGFTLVELLAVIVILTIIVIIALPVVYNGVVDSKKDYLISQTKRVYTETESRFKSGITIKVISSEDDTKLDGFDSKLKYCVYLNDEGYVVDIKVSDGEWITTLGDDQSIKDLNEENVEKGNLDNYKCKSYGEE